MGALIAGAQHRKQFEERLKAILKKVKESKNPIILFIDKIHTVLGAGATGEGAMDAANILKPILSRGELWCIEVTTHKEYRNSCHTSNRFGHESCATLFAQKNSQPEEIDNLEKKDTQLTIDKIALERAEADNKIFEIVADLKCYAIPEAKIRLTELKNQTKEKSMLSLQVTPQLIEDVVS
ncbi:chaperone Clpb, putative [Entamoeba invadens IP1]|uniref:Chaperone Clpb, putative n=1 Tax=Entamoeba invadens IP1 TaxID=370355 RepID=L7FMG7_ENTIV|nr:chaperone Clpb, putative [Entamoeba invadens IP1]ELP88757.1 chaperone Clpb, putative [Entamoeba invadens IP1]|eukprot:XP_004255528.1 chaperone Clpb, putative [Entamoeba invadens IP1]